MINANDSLSGLVLTPERYFHLINKIACILITLHFLSVDDKLKEQYDELLKQAIVRNASYVKAFFDSDFPFIINIAYALSLRGLTESIPDDFWDNLLLDLPKYKFTLLKQGWTADDLLSITFYLAQQGEIERPIDSLARPPVFPLALFIGLKLIGKLQLINKHVIAYDHQTLRMFVPDTYNEFWRDIIQDGMNFECKVGMNVWTADDIDEFISNNIAVKSIEAQKGMTQEQKISCIYCSTIIPNRAFLPFNPK